MISVLRNGEKVCDKSINKCVIYWYISSAKRSGKELHALLEYAGSVT